jgi:CxxC motif-containing protein (DUF1111 family)
MISIGRVAVTLFGFSLTVSAFASDNLDALAGKALFKRAWVPAPASTQASDGLGPLFNARSCSGCHAGGGGARIINDANQAPRLAGAAVRLGNAEGETDPFYGLQLQTDAVPGLEPEARVSFLPRLRVDLFGPAIAAGIAKSVRLAPSLYGVADFANVLDQDILSRADPEDKNGDGISGRARVTDGGIGRFGWKAAHATVHSQIAHAFAIDVGLSSPLQPFPYGDCSQAETACLGAPNGESLLTENREVSAAMLDLVAAYLKTLKRPVARSEAQSKGKSQAKGAAVFEQSGCAQCHVPSLTRQNGSKIPAFTDLLLHDMGPERDDGVGEPGVKSSEWRTAPLITAYPRGALRRYLHDGAAATVGAAVEKHGGEAASSRRAFQHLSRSDKQLLINYVGTLQ